MPSRNYNIKRIRVNWEYTTEDISALFSVTTKTVYNWVSIGLNPIEGTQCPYLFHGENLKEFIKNMLAKRRYTLQEDEFACMKCHVPRKCKPGTQKIILTEKRMGGNKLAGRKTGICEVCGKEVNKFFAYTEESKQVI